LLIGAVVWLVSGQILAFYRDDSRQANRRTSARLQLLRENVELSPLVKCYMMNRYSQTRVERHLADLSRAAWRRQRGEVLARAGVGTAGFLAGLLMLDLGGRAILAGPTSLAGLSVIGASLVALVLTVNRLIAGRVRIRRAGAAAYAISEFLDRRGEGGQPIDATFLPPLTKSFDLQEVTLKEPGTGRILLERASLSISAGQKAALVYADGDEARAVAYLAARFLDPSGGEVRIDGKNVRWVTMESLRTQVALILERSLVFSDTAANNIGCGDPGYSLPQIIEAAKMAHAHQFLSNLPYGYESRLAGGGIALTPGQAYRVALARAILRDPSLLILEEPSQAIDADSLALIDDAIHRIAVGRTVLFLARRPSTVRSADRVFVLQNGKIVASGRHDELVKGSEFYRLLHFKQSLTAGEASG
jgi:ATP-binding cassette subfamily B protein